MLGNLVKILVSLGYPKMAKNNPKWPQLASKGSNEIVETTVTTKTVLKFDIMMYLNVEYSWEKFSGALGTQKWPNKAKNSPNWSKMKFWREMSTPNPKIGFKCSSLMYFNVK